MNLRTCGCLRVNLRVRLLSGTNLPIGDSTTSDPYVILRVSDRKWRSSTHDRTLNPEWDEEAEFISISVAQAPATLPAPIVQPLRPPSPRVHSCTFSR